MAERRLPANPPGGPTRGEGGPPAGGPPVGGGGRTPDRASWPIGAEAGDDEGEANEITRGSYAPNTGRSHHVQEVPRSILERSRTRSDGAVRRSRRLRLRGQEGDVGTKQLKNNAVKTTKIAPNAVTTTDLANDAATGAKVDESSLGKVPSAANADSCHQRNDGHRRHERDRTPPTHRTQRTPTNSANSAALEGRALQQVRGLADGDTTDAANGLPAAAFETVLTEDLGIPTGGADVIVNASVDLNNGSRRADRCPVPDKRRGRGHQRHLQRDSAPRVQRQHRYVRIHPLRARYRCPRPRGLHGPVPGIRCEQRRRLPGRRHRRPADPRRRLSPLDTSSTGRPLRAGPSPSTRGGGP